LFQNAPIANDTWDGASAWIVGRILSDTDLTEFSVAIITP
jgi:hypothetical protein